MQKNLFTLPLIDYTSDNGILFAHLLRNNDKNDMEKCLAPQIPKMSVDKSNRMIYNQVHKRTNVPIYERR